MKTLLRNTIEYPPLWGGVVPLQILGIYSIYILFSNNAPEWWWIATIIGYVCIMMIGVSIGYHRLFSHKSLQVNRITKILILWLGGVSSQGTPIFWATVHRGYHHRFSDTDKDPHSPEHGFWHSYMLWQFKIRDGDVKTKYIADLLGDKDIMFFHNYYMYIMWLSHLLVALISIDLWLWFMILPSFITFHSFAIQTSLTHSKKYGYRNYNTNESSVNVWWVWPLTLGEAWHNNHHGDPKNPNYGRKWWELDPTYYIIKLLRINKPGNNETNIS